MQFCTQVQLVVTWDYLRVRPCVELRCPGLTLVGIKFAGTQDDASFSLFGHPQPESTRIEFCNYSNLLANERTCLPWNESIPTCQEALELVWPLNLYLKASSTCD